MIDISDDAQSYDDIDFETCWDESLIKLKAEAMAKQAELEAREDADFTF